MKPLSHEIPGYDAWKLQTPEESRRLRVVGECSLCQDDICEGDTYWQNTDGENACECCVDDMSFGDAEDFCGARLRVEDILSDFGCTKIIAGR